MPFAGPMVTKRARYAALIGLAFLAGCETRPKLPPGARPVVEVEPPLKSNAWKGLATPPIKIASRGSTAPGSKR